MWVKFSSMFVILFLLNILLLILKIRLSNNVPLVCSGVLISMSYFKVITKESGCGVNTPGVLSCREAVTGGLLQV